MRITATPGCWGRETRLCHQSFTVTGDPVLPLPATTDTTNHTTNTTDKYKRGVVGERTYVQWSEGNWNCTCLVIP